MRHATGPIALTIAVVAISIAGALDHADAADTRRPPKAAYAPPPGPAVGPLAPWCHPQVFPRSCHWPAPFARYDDAWCRYYGPPGSPVYAQCRANLHYERLALPLRAIK